MNFFDSLFLSNSFVPVIHKRICIKKIWFTSVVDVSGLAVELEVGDSHLVAGNELEASGFELSFPVIEQASQLLFIFLNGGPFFSSWFSFLDNTSGNDWEEVYTGFSECCAIPVQRSVNLGSDKIICWIELVKFWTLFSKISQNSCTLVHWLSINKNEWNSTSWIKLLFNAWTFSIHKLNMNSFMLNTSCVKETFDCSTWLTLHIPNVFDLWF